MSVLRDIARMFIGEPIVQERSIGEFPAFETQLAAIQRSQALARPWRAASVTEALGVPAILSAVTLISNTTGSLSLDAYRKGALLTDPEQIPQIIVRPNSMSKPFDFFRDTAFHNATRGEFWWWIARRDRDGNPTALYPVPPWEVRVEPNTQNRLRPTIRWGDRIIPNEDMRHHMYLPDESGLRGQGPLQLAGAAVSVAVEADAWAGNFFSGGMPSFVGTTDQEMTEDELKLLDAQWAEKPNNLPRWLTMGLKLSEAPYNPAKAQLTESRQHSVGEVARMFLVPGSLIEYQMSGASLHYQNDAGIWTDFQRRCLSPNYLSPIEQEMSDLLTRSTTAHFDLDQLLRADVKTRYDVYGTGIDKGIFGPEYAAQKEGILPGSGDFAPVPFAPPASIPSIVAGDMLQLRSQRDVRCENCNRKLAEAVGSGTVIRCRCGTVNDFADVQERSQPSMGEAFMAWATREQPAPIINVHPPSISVEAPAPNITFERGAFQVDAADLSGIGAALTEFADRPPPSVNVEVAAPDMSGVAEAMSALADRPQPDITVNTPEVHVAPTSVTFEEGAIQSPNVSVEPAQVTVNLPESKPTRKRLVRDDANNIIQIIEEPA